MAVSKSILYVLAVVPLALASAPDLLVPAFIPPTNLASDETIKSTAKNVTAQLESLFATGKSPFGSLGGNDTALSVQVVSLSDDKPLLDWHETPGNLNTLAGSTRRVRADSVYRIGSLSKLFTAYTLLLNDGRKYWDTPVSDILPELKGDGKGSEIEHTGWDEVTVGALASQMGGISSGYASSDLVSLPFIVAAAGLPPLPPQDIPKCSNTPEQPPCSREEWLHGYLKQHPVSQAYTTAIYANAGYHLLGYVIEAVSKHPFAETLQETVLKPLGLGQTSAQRPTQNGTGVVPQGQTGWTQELGDEASSGGMFSSVHDLAVFGKAILGNKQLSGLETRRWMKPHSHTSAWSLSVGAPWEIMRTRSEISSGRAIDMYTKSGTMGLYTSILILIPDFNIAVPILAAGSDAAIAVTVATETVIQSFLPVLEQVARIQTERKLAGTYAPSNSTSNSTLVLDVDDKTPGLLIKQWTSNGADVLSAVGLFAQRQGRQLRAVTLYPMNLEDQDGKGGKTTRHAFRALIETAVAGGDGDDVPRVEDPNAVQWELLDAFQYGGIGLEEFVFEIDEEGAAVAVEPRVMRERYVKK